jgi:hypothetical protein
MCAVDGDGHGSCRLYDEGRKISTSVQGQADSYGVSGGYFILPSCTDFLVTLDQLWVARQGNVLGAGGQFPLFHWALCGYITAYT